MSEQKKKAPVVNIGSSLLLVIFLILCLVMFATLSVTTARSNYLLSQRQADQLTRRTAADNASEEILDDLDKLLDDAAAAETSGSTGSAGDGSLSVAVSTSAGDVDVTVLRLSDGYTRLSWQIPFTDSQALAVTVELKSTGAVPDYTITQWQTLQTKDWSSTDTINVMTP